MEKHCGNDFKNDGLCQPCFPYLPPTPNLFFLVSYIVIYLTAFFLLPSTPALSYSSFLSHSPHRSKAMMSHRSQSQMEYMISSTSQPCVEIGAVPILQMMKTKAKNYEITCLKPHSHREAEARWWLVVFPSNFTSHRNSKMTACAAFPQTRIKPSPCSRTPKYSCFILRRFSREHQRRIFLLETHLDLCGSPPLRHWNLLMFMTICI